MFIIVCNNVSVSKEVYKFIAGYDNYDDEGKISNTVTGFYKLFNNYDESTRRTLNKPPTLLIDSDALENSDQVNDDFKKVFQQRFKISNVNIATAILINPWKISRMLKYFVK